MLAWDTYLSIVAMEASSLRWRINVMLIKNKNKKREKENVVDILYIYIYIFKWCKNSNLVKNLGDERQPAKMTNLTKRQTRLGS